MFSNSRVGILNSLRLWFFMLNLVLHLTRIQQIISTNYLRRWEVFNQFLLKKLLCLGTWVTLRSTEGCSLVKQRSTPKKRNWTVNVLSSGGNISSLISSPWKKKKKKITGSIHPLLLDISWRNLRTIYAFPNYSLYNLRGEMVKGNPHLKSSISFTLVLWKDGTQHSLLMRQRSTSRFSTQTLLEQIPMQ